MLSKCCCFVCAAVLAVASGCAMCSTVDDYTYGGWGGRWERLDPSFGRVGSAFTPEVATPIDGTGATIHEVEPDTERFVPEPVTPGEPTPAEDPAPMPPGMDAAPPEETSILQNRDIITR